MLLVQSTRGDFYPYMFVEISNTRVLTTEIPVDSVRPHVLEGVGRVHWKRCGSPSFLSTTVVEVPVCLFDYGSRPYNPPEDLRLHNTPGPSTRPPGPYRGRWCENTNLLREYPTSKTWV